MLFSLLSHVTPHIYSSNKPRFEGVTLTQVSLLPRPVAAEPRLSARLPNITFPVVRGSVRKRPFSWRTAHLGMTQGCARVLCAVHVHACTAVI